jgi:predicted ArsR family transcriptional regulator
VQRLTIAQAAKQLNVTQEAIRQRIRRGTIENHKGEDGRTYVYLPDEEEGVVNGVSNEYIAMLKAQIASLEKDRDEWREEAKRHQHIIMALSQRIPNPDGAPKENISLKELTEVGLEVTNIALQGISKYTRLLKRT